jgi:hypothetical protein
VRRDRDGQAVGPLASCPDPCVRVCRFCARARMRRHELCMWAGTGDYAAVVPVAETNSDSDSAAWGSVCPRTGATFTVGLPVCLYLRTCTCTLGVGSPQRVPRAVPVAARARSPTRRRLSYSTHHLHDLAQNLAALLRWPGVALQASESISGCPGPGAWSSRSCVSLTTSLMCRAAPATPISRHELRRATSAGSGLHCVAACCLALPVAACQCGLALKRHRATRNASAR